MFCTPILRSQRLVVDRSCASAPLVLPWGVMMSWRVWLQLERLQCLMWVRPTASSVVKAWKYAGVNNRQYEGLPKSFLFLSLHQFGKYFDGSSLFRTFQWKLLWIEYQPCCVYLYLPNINDIVLLWMCLKITRAVLWTMIGLPQLLYLGRGSTSNAKKRTKCLKNILFFCTGMAKYWSNYNQFCFRGKFRTNMFSFTVSNVKKDCQEES